MKLLAALAVALVIAQPGTAGAASPTSVSLDAERLPSRYVGTPFVPVYKRYVMFKPRGEFEDAAAWETRLAAVGDTQVSFVVPSAATYDIDAGRISVRVASDTVNQGYDATATASFCIKKGYSRGRPYKASNSYGHSVTVRPSVLDYYCIQDAANQSTELTFHVPLAPAAAKSLKSSIRVMVTFAPASPPDQSPVLDVTRGGVHANGFGYLEPTIGDPNEGTFNYFTLIGSIRNWIVFDSRDGKVLGRYTAEMQELTLDEAIAAATPDPDARCRKLACCIEEGKCTAAGGDCVASGSDCENRPPCRKQGRCVAIYGECVKGEQ